jgi:hypothetical protein
MPNPVEEKIFGDIARDILDDMSKRILHHMKILESKTVPWDEARVILLWVNMCITQSMFDTCLLDEEEMKKYLPHFIRTILGQGVKVTVEEKVEAPTVKH